MAVTKIWTIKDSLQRVLDYAANPDKTEYDALAQTLHYAENDAKTKLNESAQLVTGIHCRANHAWEDMRAVQERFGKTDGVVALHAYQSFRSLATFESGKQYNADLNACYNIGARYFIREVTKPMSKKAWSQCKAKVPDIERRTQCTLYSLKQLHSLLNPPAATQQPGPICWDYTVLRELCGRLTPMWRPMPSGIVS